jgi:hypothetical protein
MRLGRTKTLKKKKMSDQKPVDRGTFLDQMGFGFAEDGRIVELHLIRKSGKIAYVPSAPEAPHHLQSAN